MKITVIVKVLSNFIELILEILTSRGEEIDITRTCVNSE
jgi:hypothetical protein